MLRDVAPGLCAMTAICTSSTPLPGGLPEPSEADKLQKVPSLHEIRMFSKILGRVSCDPKYHRPDCGSGASPSESHSFSPTANGLD
jgi:hypothetical protein